MLVTMPTKQSRMIYVDVCSHFAVECTTFQAIVITLFALTPCLSPVMGEGFRVRHPSIPQQG